MRIGDWIQTNSGIEFYHRDVRPEDIDIDDIAHSLSMQCRFNGHSKYFYSVAEHCVLVSEHIAPEHALAGLLHDGAEAYMSDLPKPLKKLFPYFIELETNIEIIIAEKYGFQFPYHPDIKTWDNQLLADEAAQLMTVPPQNWANMPDPIGIDFQCWTPEQAKRRFLKRFKELV